MSNDRDQEIVNSAISDTGAGLLEFLTALGPRGHCLWRWRHAAGAHQVRRTAERCLPRSSTARFSEKWQKSVGDEGFLESIVDRWRKAPSASGPETAHQVTLFAEARNPASGASVGAHPPGRSRGAKRAAARAHQDGRRAAPPRATARTARQQCSGGQCDARPPRPTAAALSALC
jgi:hypothetical protein